MMKPLKGIRYKYKREAILTASMGFDRDRTGLLLAAAGATAFAFAVVFYPHLAQWAKSWLHLWFLPRGLLCCT